MTRDEADQALRKAIVDHALAYDLLEPGEMLDDYGVIASWAVPVEDGNCRYTTHYHRGSIPDHIAVGLFQTGVHLAQDG